MVLQTFLEHYLRIKQIYRCIPDISVQGLLQERQVSLVNKRVSIVGKDLSIDGSNGTKTAEKSHLDYIAWNASEMVENQKPTAYT